MVDLKVPEDRLATFATERGGPVKLSAIEPRRHWHVTERSGRIRLLGRMRVVHQLGADSAQAAYGVLAKRASQLMLESWQLDVDYSNDSVVVVEREGLRTVIEVSECWEVACLAARPPSGLTEGEAERIAEERRAG